MKGEPLTGGTLAWRYERVTVLAIPEYVHPELLSRFDDGWLLECAIEHPGGESEAHTVTFVFKRPRLAMESRARRRRRRSRGGSFTSAQSHRTPAAQS